MLHDHGVCASDVKPSNILLRQDGYALSGGFWPGQGMQGAEGTDKRSAMVGTPEYMAPNSPMERLIIVAILFSGHYSLSDAHWPAPVKWLNAGSCLTQHIQSIPPAPRKLNTLFLRALKT